MCIKATYKANYIYKIVQTNTAYTYNKNTVHIAAYANSRMYFHMLVLKEKR